MEKMKKRTNLGKCVKSRAYLLGVISKQLTFPLTVKNNWNNRILYCILCVFNANSKTDISWITSHKILKEM